MVKLITALFFTMLLAACGSASVKPGEKYRSSIGGFTCGPFGWSVNAQEAFGPHGGTVRLRDEIDFMRIDIQEFAPSFDADTLARMREELYKGYLLQTILPHVQVNFPAAIILHTEAATVSERPVLLSAILLPEGSSTFLGTGKRLDGIRGQVQYTNGRFMYTVSRITAARLNMSEDNRLQNALRQSQEAFKRCHFPE
jgi:hypothetical protein